MKTGCRHFVVLALLVVIAVIVSRASTPPDMINYQGVLRDALDRPINNESPGVNMVFHFYDMPTGGSPLLSDSHVGVAVRGGLFNVDLGGGTLSPPGGSLATVFANNSAVYLEIEVESEVLIPRIRIVAAAYSLNSDTLDGLHSTAFSPAVHSHLGADITSAVPDSNKLAGREPSQFLDISSLTQTKTGSLRLEGGNWDLGVTEGDFRIGDDTYRLKFGVARSGGGAGDVFLRAVGGTNRLSLGSGAYPFTLAVQNDRVGIGTPAPQQTLSVNGGMNIDQGDANTGTLASGLTFGALSGEGVASQRAAGGNGWGLDFYTAFIPRMSITNSGNVTIANGLSVTGTVESTGGGFKFPDGTVQTAAVVAENVIHKLDTRDYAGAFKSIAVGRDGFPVISYNKRPAGLAVAYGIRVAHCENSHCTSATLASLSGDTEMWYTSIAVGSDGSPVVSVFDSVYVRLLLYHCNDASCTSSTYAVVDATPGAGRYSSVAIGTDGFPVISYALFSYPQDQLRVAHCLDVRCTSREITSIDPVLVQDDTTLAIGADGFPVVSYVTAGGSLKVVHCLNTSCTSSNSTTVVASGVQDAALAIGADGFPVISYTEAGLKVAHCSDVSCTTAPRITTLDASGGDSSIAVGPDGGPVISYLDMTNLDLKVAHCLRALCDYFSLTVLDSVGNVGYDSAIAIGSDGRAVIAYSDGTNSDLKVITGVSGPVGKPLYPFAEDKGPIAQSDVSTQVPNATERSGPQTDTRGGFLIGPPHAPAGGCAAPSGAVLTDAGGNVYGKSFRPSTAVLATLARVSERVEEGDVLVIDTERPALLSLSRVAEDTAVFGITADEPGVLLGASPLNEVEAEGSQETTSAAEPGRSQDDSEVSARGDDIAVAVAGVTLCKVDAGYGPIRVGDLLTTSPTPGHAMRSIETLPGTIIGKALEPMQSGTGLIKVLVMAR